MIERYHLKATHPDTIRGILLFTKSVGGIATDTRMIASATGTSLTAIKSPSHPVLAEFSQNQQILLGHLSERICTVIHPHPKRNKSIIVPDHTPRVIDPRKLFGLGKEIGKATAVAVPAVARTASEGWWALGDLNPEPTDYESGALTD